MNCIDAALCVEHETLLVHCDGWPVEHVASLAEHGSAAMSGSFSIRLVRSPCVGSAAHLAISQMNTPRMPGEASEGGGLTFSHRVMSMAR